MQRYRTFQFALFITVGALAAMPSTTQAAPIWTVRGVSSEGTPLLSIADAMKLLDGEIAAKTDVTASYTLLNFNEPDLPAAALFTGSVEFPGASPGHEKNFAIEATGTITIPQAGAYTFGINSDDGFSLQVGSFTMSHTGLRSVGQTYGTFNFTQAGNYPVDLLYFQHSVYAELELFASPGAYTSIGQSGSHFELVGDSTDGGLTLATASVGTSAPEPSSLALLAPLGLGLLWRPKRRAQENDER